MIRSIFNIGVILLIIVCLSSFSPDKGEIKRARDIISKALQVDSIELIDGVYRIKYGGNEVGKLYFRELRPKIETFRYFVAIRQDGTIICIDIIDYHSAHGYGITKRKWLDKFSGMKLEALKRREGIDAISGGTLSVNFLLRDLITLLEKQGMPL